MSVEAGFFGLILYAAHKVKLPLNPSMPNQSINLFQAQPIPPPQLTKYISPRVDLRAGGHG